MFNEIGPRTLSPSASTLSKSPGLIHIFGLGAGHVCSQCTDIVFLACTLWNQRAVAIARRATEGKQTSQAVGAVPDIFIDSVSCTLGFTN